MELKELAFPSLEECDNVIIIKKSRRLVPTGLSSTEVLFDSADYMKINGKVVKNRWGKTDDLI